MVHYRDHLSPLPDVSGELSTFNVAKNPSNHEISAKDKHPLLAGDEQTGKAKSFQKSSHETPWPNAP